MSDLLHFLFPTDLMNGMYRVESDNSVDADEPIMKHLMEGGVTILKQMDRKRRVRYSHLLLLFYF